MTANPTNSKNVNRVLAVLCGVSCGLLFSAGVLVGSWNNESAGDHEQLVFAAERTRRAEIKEMVSETTGLFDSYIDADVARVLLPNAVTTDVGSQVATNSYGLRERAFEWKKPDATVRVVLLGDSFVFGYGVEAEDRMGVHLEQYLAQNSPEFEGSIECLHIAITSWNILAECSYLRRQISDLRPDLVVQIVVLNDLDDSNGARGFGAMARFSPQVRDRANGLVQKNVRPGDWGLKGGASTPLMYGFDYESRQRYAMAAAEIANLSRATKAVGGRYLLLSHFSIFNPLVPTLLAPGLSPDQLAYISYTMAQDRNLWNSASDRHWNRAGHQQVATLLYGLIQERDLLPSLQLESWTEATDLTAKIHGDPRNSERPEAVRERGQESSSIHSELDFRVPNLETASQVYAGIDGQGRVAPYASLILRNDNHDSVELSCVRLPRPEIAQGLTRVFVEEFELGVIPFDEAGPFSVTWELPLEVRSRPFLNLRFESNDYVTVDPTNPSCVAFEISSIALR